MLLNEFQKRQIRQSPLYKVIFEDMAEAGFLEKKDVEELLAYGPKGKEADAPPHPPAPPTKPED
jgi:hypothetical protein